MTPIFTPAQIDDLDVLMQYMEDFHNFDHSEPFDTAPARKAMKAVVTDPKIGRVWLIQLADKTIGYMVLTLAYRLEYRGCYAFLDELYILADKRGQGIGTKALKFLSQFCREQGVLVLQLEVKQDNPAAMALYQREGFVSQCRTVLFRNC